MYFNTIHASVRQQQRTIPNIVGSWLDEFGKTKYDGHGGLIVFFDKQSRKKMEKELGRKFVKENQRYLSVFRVDSVTNGMTITIGWRT